MISDIEHGIKLPSPGKNSSKYKWRDMRIGDSLLYHEGKRPNCAYWGLVTGFSFTMRKDKPSNRYRVWRLE